MRILGLDFGEKRIGVAITDPLGITAQGIDVITYTTSDEAFGRIEVICRSYGVEKIVVGNPLNMNGTKGAAAENALLFTNRLKRLLNRPVVLIDERLTSVSAEKTLIAGGVNRKNRREVRDKLAAALILELYMSLQQNEYQCGE